MTHYKSKSFLLIGTVLLFVCTAVSTVSARIEDMHRVDLRNLGLPMVNDIPANSSAITSLITGSDGNIYGATSGEQAYMLVYEPSLNKVKHLGKIKDQTGAHHSLVEGADKCLYVGSGKNMFETVKMSKWGPPDNGKEDLIPWDDIYSYLPSYEDHVLYEMKQSKGDMGYQYVDIILWNDIKNHFKDYAGGHLYRYSPAASNEKIKLADMDCELEDLGIPVAKNSIYALTASPDGNTIYGLTYPDGHFFIYDIRSKGFKDLGEIIKEIIFHGPERQWRSLPRALVCDDSGRVYTTGSNGAIVYYDPNTGKIVPTKVRIPGDYYYAQAWQDYAVVDCFVRGSNGLIYGGSSDGYLFSFNPEKSELVNLGKVRACRRIRCMTVGKNGKIYMMAGERIPSMPCQFYSYDPAKGGFEDIGLLKVDRSPYYYRFGFQFDGMTCGRDGTVFLGESERGSSLFLYIP